MNINTDYRYKDYTIDVTLNHLPANEEQMGATIGFLDYVKQRKDVFISILIKDPEMKGRVPQVVSLTDAREAYYMELEYSMDEFDWNHPLILANDHLSADEAKEVLISVFNECTDDIPLIEGCFGEISSRLYSDEEEDQNY